MKHSVPIALVAAFALASAIMLAHTEHDDASELMYGFAHPIIGILL